MLKRQASEGVEQQKRDMIAAVYSNSNYETEDIKKAVEALENHYKAAIEMIYPKPGALKRKQGQEPDWDNPFWAGAARSYAKQREALEHLRGAGGTNATVQDVATLHERRTKRLESYDQTATKK